MSSLYPTLLLLLTLHLIFLLRSPRFCNGNPLCSQHIECLLHPFGIQNNDLVEIFTPLFCKGAQEELFGGINRYRESLNLSALSQDDTADCLADESARKLENKPCYATLPIGKPLFLNYSNLPSVCQVKMNSIKKNRVILQACIPGLQPDLVLSNFTETWSANYLSDPNYTNVGITFAVDWVIVVLISFEDS